ncbi:MAG: OOP family OmpA-OmpF porin [Pseudohongiellaceae bacterium]|jgi:OOP family OmpA-OmpF porin
MTMRRTIQSLLALSLPFVAATSNGEEGQFYIAPGLQWMEFDNTVNLDNDTGYFLGLGYDFTDRLSAEFSIFDLDPELPNNTQVEIDHWKVNAFYSFDTKIAGFTPFIVGGVGNTRFEADNEMTFDYGAGLKIEITKNLEWRTAVRNYNYLDRDFEDSDFGIDSALVFRFGGKAGPSTASRPSAPSAPAAPAREEAPAVTIADADQDGVADSADRCPETPRNYAVDSSGCPIPVEEVARVELEVYFDFDQSEVKAEYFDEIKEVTDFMAQYPDVIIELEGHTDSRGAEAYNLALSDRRAAAVRQVMISRFGMVGSRISSNGFGETQPIASNDTDAGRADNRRVMTVIIKTLQNYRPR